jgi:hypothetical protein
MRLRSGHSTGGMDESNAPAPDPRIEQLIQLAQAQNQSLQQLQQQVRQQAQALASTSTAITGATAPTAPAPSTRIRISDLPEFSGTRHSLDTEQFLVDLSDLFHLYGTLDSDKGTYAVKAINQHPNSPAASWLADRRNAGAFKDPTQPDIEIDFNLFCQELRAHFQVPVARRLQLEDTWDRFTQKGTVEDHFVKFNKVLKQLRELKVKHSDDVIASKFLRSLKPELRELVILRIKEDDIPPIKDLYHRALESEYQTKASHPVPRMQGIFPDSGNKKDKKGNRQDKPSNQKNGVYCIYHRTNDHSTEDCPKIKELKAAGKWRSKPKEQSSKANE